jgi:hypothetical protein
MKFIFSGSAAVVCYPARKLKLRSQLSQADLYRAP